MDKNSTKYWIRVYAVFAVSFLTFHYLMDLDIVASWLRYIPFLKKLSMSLLFVSLILLCGKIIEGIINKQAESEGDRHNLLRITRLLSIIFIIIVAASFMFQNLYAAAVSFGLISLVLGFALQSPITSFIAWLYIVFRRPYQVGHRIQINGIKGDVIEISYLDTTILECGGDYLGNDRRSGRIMHFPNSVILKEQVFNYSGPQMNFIWNETPIQVAFTSDLKFVERCLVDAAESDFKERHPTLYKHRRLEWQPSVYFRVNKYAWLEAVIMYPVEYEDTTGKRNRILTHALVELNKNPDKVQFPEGTIR